MGFFDDFLKGWNSGNDRPASSTNPLGKNLHWDPAAMAVLGTAAGGSALYGPAVRGSALYTDLGVMAPVAPRVIDRLAPDGILAAGIGVNGLYDYMTGSGGSASPAAAPIAQDMVNRKPAAAQPADPIAQDMVNRKPGAIGPSEEYLKTLSPLGASMAKSFVRILETRGQEFGPDGKVRDYKQFREPGSGRTPALLKEMQTGGMMPKDMQLSRFMTMPSPDYLGTLNENTASSTGNSSMAKNRLPPASLQQPPLPEPIYNPGPFTDPTPDRTAAIGGLTNPDYQQRPWDAGPRIDNEPVATGSGGNAIEEQVVRRPMSREEQLRQQFAEIDQRHQAALQAERDAKAAESARLRREGGYLPGGNGYVTPRPGAWTPAMQSEVDNFSYNNPRPSPTTLNRLPGEVPPSMRPSPVAQATSQYMPGRSVYNSGGIEQGGAIKTGDPFFDVNIDWDRLEKEKLLKDHNDAVSAKANDARLGGIAGDRQAADAKRAAGLAAQGMTQEQIDMRMHPERFAAPKDPAIEQAKAIDAAERQGRSNVHAIAQKFMRNGLGSAAAYSAAMNMVQTTNPGNMGAVPSLPSLDPMRVIQTSSPGTGMAAAQQSVGTTRANNDLTLNTQNSSDRRYDTDSRERVGMAQAANGGNIGLIDLLIKLQNQQMNQGVVNSTQANEARDAALRFIQDPANSAMQYGTPEQQAIWKAKMQAANGGAPTTPGAPATPGAPPIQPGALSSGIPQGGVDPSIVHNPVALQQHVNSHPEPDRPRVAALLYARAGVANPALDSYLTSKYGQDAAYDPVYAAQRAEQEEGFPREAALRVFQTFYRNQGRNQ